MDCCDSADSGSISSLTMEAATCRLLEESNEHKIGTLKPGKEALTESGHHKNAALKPVEEALRNELECPVCMDEPRLHLLPCAHRCCMPCVDRLAGEDREMDCPICRRRLAVPDQGFPVCVLTERIKDELEIAKENAAGAEDDAAHAEQERTRCEVCSENKVESRCNTCLKFLCFRCGVKKKSKCSSGNEKHDIEDIDDILTHNQILLKDWQTLATSEVEKLKEGLVTMTEREAELDEEQTTLEKKQEAVRDELRTLKQDMERKQTELNEKSSFLKVAEIIESEGDPVEIIRLQEQIVAYGSSDLQSPTDPDSEEEDITQHVPSTLQFLSEHQTQKAQCVTVDHHSVTGDILLGCSDGIKRFKKASYEIEKISKHTTALVVEHKDEIFLSSHDENKTVIKVSNYDPDKKTSELIYSFPMKAKVTSHLSVSERFIASIDKDTNKIKLFNRKYSQAGLIDVNVIEIKELKNLLFISEDLLLVTGWDSDGKDMLNNYRINGSDLDLIWSCDQVPYEPCGIALDDTGMIYVCGLSTRTIYVLDKKGVKLTALSHDKLPAYYEDISIRRSELAIPGWKDKKLLLFHIS